MKNLKLFNLHSCIIFVKLQQKEDFGNVATTFFKNTITYYLIYIKFELRNVKFDMIFLPV